jgi:hypothetical protein
MTAQITDSFLFKDEKYDVIGVERDTSIPVSVRLYSGELFSPKEYGLQP